MYGYRGGGDIHGEESVKDKLLRVWGNSVSIILEGEHREVAWYKCNSDKGGRNMWGRE